VSFTCPYCKMTSHHPMDEKFRYCGNCRWFTADGPPPHLAQERPAPVRWGTAKRLFDEAWLIARWDGLFIVVTAVVVVVVLMR